MNKAVPGDNGELNINLWLKVSSIGMRNIKQSLTIVISESQITFAFASGYIKGICDS